MSRLEHVRAHAYTRSLFPATSLRGAIDTMGFVQADPIRSPARAQDLILRHRVHEYRAGDLDRAYGTLDLEEDVLYAYGFMPHQVWRLLHPRRAMILPSLEREVMMMVRSLGPLHPRELEKHFGRERVVNTWGGYSKATKCALEHLHYVGLVRVAGRENGIRIYEVAPDFGEPAPLAERLTKLILVVANLLAPVPERSLQEALAPLRRAMLGAGNTRYAVEEMVGAGLLCREVIEGMPYLWPVEAEPVGETGRWEAPDDVRLLAPFDPLVWDRRRFEHIWGWQYRFEAYTPVARRVRGYYAMPMLWRDVVIGWGNVNVVDRRMSVELGFVGKRPRERAFEQALEAEIERMNRFLNLADAAPSPQ
ncbi:MAG: crosslink repair DNA glycosylase YcaQ family protein [Bacteroidota bacterium]